MYVNRKLLILWLVCLLLICGALVIRFSGDRHSAERQEIITAAKNGIDRVGVLTDILGPSESFYDQELEQDQEKDGELVVKQPQTSSKPSVAVVSARAYLVGDVETGKIYMQKSSSLVLPVASMSKLITAVSSIDKLQSTQKISIPIAASTTPDTSNFKMNETFTVGEMLYPLLLNSSNVAAEALASTTNRAKFLELMSGYAWEIGMPSTFFADPSGIDSRNVSTAKDFFALAQYLFKSRPNILAITKTPQYSVSTTTDHGSHVFYSIHPFVSDPNFLGGKTGHTESAKDTMLTIIRIGGRPIAIIVLASNNRKTDTTLLIKEVQKIMSNQTTVGVSTGVQ